MRKTISCLLLATALIVLFLWLRRTEREGAGESAPTGQTAHQDASNPATRLAANLVAQSGQARLNVTNSVLDESISKSAALARAAKLFNFDSSVTGFRVETNRAGWHVVYNTPTHVVDVMRGRLNKLMALNDNSSPRDRAAVKRWHECTARWSEADAVQETKAILTRLGETETLKDIATGRHEYQAVEITVGTPDGQKIKVAPFPTVRLYDANDVLRVKAEFRMGSNGMAGLTDWFHLH